MFRNWISTACLAMHRRKMSSRGSLGDRGISGPRLALERSSPLRSRDTRRAEIPRSPRLPRNDSDHLVDVVVARVVVAGFVVAELSFFTFCPSASVGSALYGPTMIT